ncbi:hypothetical protein H0H87_009584 [Tephrocybe sp. NHM501043]|nr:hypothetical protein H0H87_009584 [Tephrocybe sp. NHM501043]
MWAEYEASLVGVHFNADFGGDRKHHLEVMAALSEHGKHWAQNVPLDHPFRMARITQSIVAIEGLQSLLRIKVGLAARLAAIPRGDVRGDPQAKDILNGVTGRGD